MLQGKATFQSVLLVIQIIAYSCQDIEQLEALQKHVLIPHVPQISHHNRSKELTKQWEAYYQCQQTQYKQMLADHFTAQITALAAFEGSRVLLTCSLCLSPLQQESDISWHIMKGQHIEPLNMTGAYLHFNNLAPEEKGVYACKFVNLIRKVYFLHVLHEPEEPIVQAKLLKQPRMLKDAILETSQGIFKVFSEWGQWSKCSEAHRCGYVGRRIKYGPCVIVSNELELENQQPWIKYFPKGLPCRSLLVPISVRNMPEVRQHPSEVILGYCKVKCRDNHNNKLEEAWNKRGQLMADNGEGIFSLLQGKPKLPVPPTREYMFPYKGDTLTIKCHGFKESDSPVQWHKVNTTINQRGIQLQTKERITIDVLGHIHFKSMYVKDTNIYSCWQEGRLVSTVKIRVMARDFVFSKLHWSLFMASAVLICLLLALYQIYKKDTT